MSNRQTMSAEVLSREELYHAKLKREMKRQDEARFIDPDLIEYVPRVWVAYIRDGAGTFVVAGFFRTQRLKLPRVRKIRKRLKLAPEQVLHLTDLFTAAKHGGPKHGRIS
jgi:hypothetical protein